MRHINYEFGTDCRVSNMLCRAINHSEVAPSVPFTGLISLSSFKFFFAQHHLINYVNLALSLKKAFFGYPASSASRSYDLLTVAIAVL